MHHKICKELFLLGKPKILVKFFNHLPNAPPPSAIILGGLGFNIWIFRRHKHSVYSTTPSKHTRPAGHASHVKSQSWILAPYRQLTSKREQAKHAQLFFQILPERLQLTFSIWEEAKIILGEISHHGNRRKEEAHTLWCWDWETEN